MENLYRILNCSETASFQELKKSYQSLALQYHPDKSQHSQVNGSEKFVRINHAWKVLSDARLREQYDSRWRERCLVQAYPVQDSVDFDEFENVETCTKDACEEFRELQESKNSRKCKPDGGCEVLQDKDAVVDDPNMDKLSGGSQSTETHPEEMEINFSASDEIGSHLSDIHNGSTSDLSDIQNRSTSVQGVVHNSPDNTIYRYDCRCGGSYVLTDVDVQLRFDIVCCDTCSLSVQVIYDTELEGN